MRPKIQMKGIKDGLLVSLGDGTWDELHQVLLDFLDQQAEFLKGGRLAFDVGNMVIKAVDLGQLQKELSARDLSLWAIITNSPLTEQTAQSFGLATRITKPRPIEVTQKTEGTLSGAGEALLIRRTLRSGFVIEHSGHVVVIGDVNPGAEIVSNGDIVVWGKLRGTVHAGFEGDKDAVICALDLSPLQLRIAGNAAISPKKRAKPSPEMARLRDDQVIYETWDPKRERL